MLKRSLVLGAALGAVSISLGARDLFIRPDAFFVAPRTRVVLPVLNRIFSTTENAVARDRLTDVSMVGPSGRRAVPQDLWTEIDPRSTVTIETEGDGTYLVGAALKPRLLSLPASEFNAHLKDEGIEAILRERRARGALGVAPRERYAKFVKALVQVGTQRSGMAPSWGTRPRS